MKIKVFTSDRDGNITLTKKELEELMNEAYWEGYNAPHSTLTSTWGSPFYWSTNNGHSYELTCSDSISSKTNGTMSTNVSDDSLLIQKIKSGEGLK